MSKIPKDRQIIIDTHYGTYVAVWNGVNKEFVYANPVLIYRGEYVNTYYGTQYIKEKEILSWSELKNKEATKLSQ